MYVYASNALLYPLSLVKTPAGLSDIDYVQGVDIAGQRVEICARSGASWLAPIPSRLTRLRRSTNNGPNPLAAALPGWIATHQESSPYGTISAINLDKGEIVWQIAHGETPDFVRNHPALKGLNIPRTGQPGYDTGTMVTKSLVVAGDGMVTTTADHPRGAMLRAYDKMTGKEVGAVFLPAPQSGSPMTYMVNGKQYIVVAVSGGNYSGEYIAFSLPSVP